MWRLKRSQKSLKGFFDKLKGRIQEALDASFLCLKKLSEIGASIPGRFDVK